MYGVHVYVDMYRKSPITQQEMGTIWAMLSKKLESIW